MYAPLVRPGGLIAFHDIVPDFKSGYSITTDAYVGEVPALWRQLKQEGHKTWEFVLAPEQDGFGIGVLEWR